MREKYFEIVMNRLERFTQQSIRDFITLKRGIPLVLKNMITTLNVPIMFLRFTQQSIRDFITLKRGMPWSQEYDYYSQYIICMYQFSRKCFFFSAHPVFNCCLHYSQVTVDPQKSIDYVRRNRNKKVIYRSFVTNSNNNITVGFSFHALVNSGIVHPTAVLMCPFIAATTGTNIGFRDLN